MCNNFLWSIEHQRVTSLVAIDLSAAFDTVDHEILLDVFSTNIGVKGSAYSWFKSYLSARPQKCSAYTMAQCQMQ